MIDAGLAPLEARGVIRASEAELVAANDTLADLTLYSNQSMFSEEDWLTNEYVIKWKFTTPCITSLPEEK